jgi:hypothetical protein
MGSLKIGGNILLLFVFFQTLNQPSNSYETYLDGVYNDYLPGSQVDPLHRPNFPFSTDSNRFSDGVTSSSAFDISSPHFPRYNGFSADVSDRYDRHRLYVESAAAQGVAIYGLGDARNEDAKVKILSHPNYPNIPNPITTFPVYASIKWNPSDFAIREGEYYNISVLPSSLDGKPQYWFDGGIQVGPKGYVSYFDAVSDCYVALGRCRPHLKKRRRLTSANWMSLTCAVGQFVIPLTETEPGKESEYRYLPLDESALIPTIFDVGEFIQFRAIHTGELICFANDAHTLYWNNLGYLNVTVTRVSWPPTKNLVYQEQYLPSCDSAAVVYANNGINGGNVACNPNGGAGWTESEFEGK